MREGEGSKVQGFVKLAQTERKGGLPRSCLRRRTDQIWEDFTSWDAAVELRMRRKIAKIPPAAIRTKIWFPLSSRRNSGVSVVLNSRERCMTLRAENGGQEKDMIFLPS